MIVEMLGFNPEPVTKKTKTLPVLLVLAFSITSCTQRSSYYLAKGDRLFSNKKYEEAALNFRHAIQVDPRSGEAYYQLGRTDVLLNKGRDAFQSLVRAAELMPSRDDVKVSLADVCLSALVAGGTKRPEALYDRLALLSDQIIAKNPRSYDGLRFKGYLAVIDNRLAEAEKFFEKANEIKPMEPELIVVWTGTLFQDDKAAQGEALALKLVEKDKTYGPIYDQLARQYLALNRVSDAENILRAKVKNNPADAESVIQLALFYAERSQEQEMKTVLKQMVDRPATFPKAHLAVGDFYSRMRRWDAAEKEYQQGADSDPKDELLYLKRIADLWLAQGKGEQAAKVVSKIIKERPLDDSAKAVQASLLLASGKPEKMAEAVSQFQALVKKSPENAIWRLNLGLALAAKGEAVAARGELHEAIKIKFDFLQPRLALAQLSEAEGDYQAAVSYEDEILAINENLPAIRMQRVLDLMNAGRYSEVRGELTRLKQTYPTEVELQFAVLDMKQRNFTQAEHRFRELLEHDRGNAAAISGLAQSYDAQNQFEKTFLLLQEKVNEFPNSEQLRFLLANSALRVKTYEVAIQQYQRLLARNPQSAQLHLRLAAAYQYKGDLQNAIENFRTATVLAPKDATPFALLGGALIVAGRRSEAIESFRHSLELQPDNPSVLNDLAFALVDSGGSLDEALALAEKALRIAPQQPDVSDTLAWVYYKRNLTDNAVQIYRWLVRKYPDKPEFRYHFGLVLLKKGDNPTARAELKAALSSSPSKELRESIQAVLVKIG
jgi:tetratricopeptide (TPR) repeat protein